MALFLHPHFSAGECSGALERHKDAFFIIISRISIGKDMDGKSCPALNSGRWKTRCLAQRLADGKHPLQVPNDPRDDDDSNVSL